MMEGAPILVALSRAIDRPVLLLALFCTVSPLLAPATEIDGGVTDLVAETTVHDKVILTEKVRLSGKVGGIVQVYLHFGRQTGDQTHLQRKWWRLK